MVIYIYGSEKKSSKLTDSCQKLRPWKVEVRSISLVWRPVKYHLQPWTGTALWQWVINWTSLHSEAPWKIKFQQLNVIHVQKHIKLNHFNVWEHSAIILFHKSVSASNLRKTYFYSLHLNIPHYSQLKLICLIMSWRVKRKEIWM